MNLTHDVQSGMVDMMQKAQHTYAKAWNNESIKMYASPWSPPPWMKARTPDDPKDALHAENMTNSAKVCLRDGVGPNSKYAKAWALYFSKFITACK
jgi:glucosylceramidase